MKTAVITTGGLGTRLFTITKVLPKTMLPLFEKNPSDLNSPILRPLIEIIFNDLYDMGFRRFCFIVGEKTKQVIIDHFNKNDTFINLLKKRNSVIDKRFIKSLENFDKKFDKCEVSWITQSTPMGFGHALLSSKKFVGNETFLLYAGDAFFLKTNFLSDFIHNHQKSKDAICSVLLERKKYLKGFGIAQVKKKNNENVIFNMEEKPKKPKSNLAVLPVYIFDPLVFDALQNTMHGYNNELQVTDAIQTLIDWNKKVLSFNYKEKSWFDIGIPMNYHKALSQSFKISTSNKI
jgi:UTP--glucose-1-phosphate uridylyltransferase